MLALNYVLSMDPRILVPLSGIALPILITAIIAGAIAYTRVRARDIERDLAVRRMAHEAHMKQLQIEELRLRAGQAGTGSGRGDGSAEMGGSRPGVPPSQV